MNKFLAIETSAATGSWALFENGVCIQKDEFHDRASGSLCPSLLAAQEQLKGLEKIIVGVGPGSFSGIRVGIASAQGLAAVLNCPVIPIRSTHALAWQYRNENDLGIFADARRGQFFHTAYANGRLTTPTHLITAAELKLYGKQHNLSVAIEPITVIPRIEFPSAENLGYAALQFPPEENLALDPIYLHAPVNTTAK